MIIVRWSRTSIEISRNLLEGKESKFIANTLERFNDGGWQHVYRILQSSVGSPMKNHGV